MVASTMLEPDHFVIIIILKILIFCIVLKRGEKNFEKRVQNRKPLTAALAYRVILRLRYVVEGVR